MRDGDVVLWFNFRADRARQLTEAFMDPAFANFATEGRPKLAGYYTLTEYKETYSALGVLLTTGPRPSTMASHASLLRSQRLSRSIAK